MSKSLIIGEEEITIPDMIQPVTAYRTFFTHQKQLFSPSQNIAWNTKKQTAKCHHKYSCPQEQIPQEDCTCGLYGFSKLEYLQTNSFYNQQEIIAVSEHWGKTVVHQDGIRSQHAKIKAIAPLNQSKKSFKVEDLLMFFISCITFLSLWIILLTIGTIHLNLLTISTSLILYIIVNTFSFATYSYIVRKIERSEQQSKLKRLATEYNAILCYSVKDLEQYHTTSIK